MGRASHGAFIQTITADGSRSVVEAVSEKESVMGKKAHHAAEVSETNPHLSRAILTAVILALGATTNGFAQLLGQWHFDEVSGSVASDSAGVNDGELNGDAAFVSGGIVGNAVSVSRAGNGFVEMGDVFPMTSGDFSVVVWVKTNPGDQQSDLFPVAKHESGTVNGYLIAVNTSSIYGQTDKAYFYASVNPGAEAISTTSVNTGMWHQVVGIYQASGQADIFVDGGHPEDSEPVPAIVDNAAPLMAGAINIGSTPTGHFDGQLDELQIFGHALNDEEVRLLFDNPQMPLMFANGFESGDTSAWSAVVP